MTEPPGSDSIDTPEGCRTHAVQDRGRAAGMDTDNGRLRLERSADAWDARADALQDLVDTQDVRRAEAIAEWDEAERRDSAEDDEGGAA